MKMFKINRSSNQDIIDFHKRFAAQIKKDVFVDSAGYIRDSSKNETNEYVKNFGIWGK